MIRMTMYIFVKCIELIFTMSNRRKERWVFAAATSSMWWTHFTMAS